jgi:spermidine/putrescine transport system substrate-binding protein
VAPIVQTPAPAATPQTGAAPKEINVYMYSEYISPEQIQDFEKKTGLKVRLSVYEATEEMLAKLQQAGGVSQYDVVVASDHAIPVMARLGLIQPIDPARVPNKKNITENFANPPYDPGNKYSIPYQWGTMGIMYRKDKVASLDPSWSVFFDEARQPGPFVLIDSMRDMMTVALKYKGHSINTRKPEELRQAGELILQAKKSPKMLGFDGGVGGKNKVVSGQAVMAIAYNGDVVRAMDEDKNVAYVIPKEGTLIWVDAMVIPSKAPNVTGALEFINYILEPKAGAELSNFNRYATPNQASLPFITPADRNNPAIYPSKEEIAKMQYLEDIDKDTRLYDEVWMAVKSR